jgi:Flp pilus assembly protein TadD
VRRTADGRRSGVLLTVLLVLLGGALIQGLQTRTTEPLPATPDARRQTTAPPTTPRAAEVKQRFDQAVVMLHAKRYDEAATALHRVLALAPKMPEAHVNMGFALLGLGRAKAARDFFDTATELAPGQANAYYGLAMAYESLGDLRLALSAMRSYLHLAGDESDAHLRRARAALWEWESRLTPPEPAASSPVSRR